MYLCMKEPYLQVSGTDALSGTGGMWHLVGRGTIEDGKTGKIKEEVLYQDHEGTFSQV